MFDQQKQRKSPKVCFHHILVILFSAKRKKKQWNLRKGWFAVSETLVDVSDRTRETRVFQDKFRSWTDFLVVGSCSRIFWEMGNLFNPLWRYKTTYVSIIRQRTVSGSETDVVDGHMSLGSNWRHAVYNLSARLESRGSSSANSGRRHWVHSGRRLCGHDLWAATASDEQETGAVQLYGNKYFQTVLFVSGNTVRVHAASAILKYDTNFLPWVFSNLPLRDADATSVCVLAHLHCWKPPVKSDARLFSSRVQKQKNDLFHQTFFRCLPSCSFFP